MAKPTPRINHRGVGGFGPSRTQQHPSHDTDINTIMARHARLPAGSPVGGIEPNNQYMDLTILPQNLMDAQNLVIDMKHRFSRYPSRVRARFANDPVQMLRFLEDPANHPEAVRLGLLAPAAPGSRGDSPPDGSQPRSRPQASDYQEDLVEHAERPKKASPPHAKRREPDGD